jgi:hypothetical protein
MKSILTWKAENLTPMIGEEKADTGIEMMAIKKTGNVLNWFFLWPLICLMVQPLLLQAMMRMAGEKSRLGMKPILVQKKDLPCSTPLLSFLKKKA